MLLAPSRGLGGGIERYVSTVIDALEDAGARVVRRDLVDSGSRSRARKARACATAALDVVRLRPTHVFVMHPNLFTLGRHLARVARATALGWVYGVEVFTAEKAAAVVKRAAGLHLVAISHYTKSWLTRAGASDVAVVHGALSPAWLALAATVSANRVEAPQTTLCAVTRFDEDVAFKGVDTLIELVARFERHGAPIELDLIGLGPLLSHYRALAVERGVAHRVRFHGYLPDAAMADVMARAHLFALPSRVDPAGTAGEGLGIVYLEAASLGVPVIGSTSGGAAETVVDEVTGVLVDPTDIDALEEAVTRLRDDVGLRRKFGEEGRRWTHEEFAMAHLKRQLSELLDR